MDLGAFLKEPAKYRLLERKHLGIPHRPDGRGSALVIDQGHLAEALAWLHYCERFGRTIDRHLIDQNIPGGKKKEPAARITFANDLDTVWIVDLGRQCEKNVTFGLTQTFKQRNVKSFEPPRIEYWNQNNRTRLVILKA
jgi:hypothetical protein